MRPILLKKVSPIRKKVSASKADHDKTGLCLNLPFVIFKINMLDSKEIIVGPTL